MASKLNLLSVECEEKYGDSEKAEMKGEIYMKAIMKYSEVDTRALFLCLAAQIPRFNKLIVDKPY